MILINLKAPSDIGRYTDEVIKCRSCEVKFFFEKPRGFYGPKRPWTPLGLFCPHNHGWKKHTSPKWFIGKKSGLCQKHDKVTWFDGISYFQSKYEKM